jgi:ribosomal protein S18 acetylase RimI-like enzyme
MTARALYTRGMATAIRCWERFASSVEGAEVLHAPGVTAAVFPTAPERGIYNNAVLHRDLESGARDAAIVAMEDAYAAAGIGDFAAWVHATDSAMIEDLEHRSYRCTESTRAMGMTLEDFELEIPAIEVRDPTWGEYQRFLERFGVPAGLLPDVDASAFHVSLATLGCEDVATALSFDHDGDCGIYNVSTLGWARRRGLGAALTALHVHQAKLRGCSTASLQSTAIGERVYARVGFKDLGRILEFAPRSSAL